MTGGPSGCVFPTGRRSTSFDNATKPWAFQLQTIHQESEGQSEVSARLTAQQRDALVAAYEAGHFDVPQRASQQEVAARLDIAPQSLSERLRRGIRTLIEVTLIPE